MRKLAKKIEKVPVLGPCLKRISWAVLGPLRSASYWIAKVGTQEAQVVQIGSNDGREGDPVFEVLKMKPDWRALFVEPVPHLFERLKKNYGNQPRYQFANVAINNGETMPFYHVDPAAREELNDLPVWFDQIGSFERGHIVKHLGGILEPFILETSVEGCRLDDLFRQYEIDRIDLLHIDAEGYDWKILSQLDLGAMKPEMILLEQKHLPIEEKRAAFRFLEGSYLLYYLNQDFMAIRKDADKKLRSKLWMLYPYKVTDL